MRSSTSNREWPTVPLETAADIVMGGTPSTGVAEYWHPPEIDWVTAKDVSECSEARISITERQISRAGLENSSAKVLPALATVLIARGATMGTCRMISRPMALNQTCYGIVAKDGTDARFIYYYLSNQYQRFRAMAHGTVFDTVIGTGLRSLPITLPPLTEQRAIAHILGTLDDKIELNRRMNETLKAIARAIFKSWFVDFDPVRAKMENRPPLGMDAETAALFPDASEDSPLGKIPKGWHIGTVGELGDVICGKTPPTANPDNYGGSIPFITIPDMHGRVFVTTTSSTLTEQGAQTQPKKGLPPLAVCVSCIATPGLVALTSAASHTNQQINSIVCHDEVSPYWCFLQLQTMRDEIITGGAGGSATLNLNKGNFSAMRLLVPDRWSMAAFHDVVEPLFCRILLAERESGALGALRDTLLPRLLSGKMRVQPTEVATEATA